MTRPEPVFSLDAEADVAHAAEYYEAQRPSFGFAFLGEVYRLTELIRETPHLFTLVDPPIRRALLRRFPFGLFYLPGTFQQADVVVAVIDLRQDPEVIRRAYRR